VQTRIRFDFIKTRYVWFAIALIFMATGLASLGIRKLNYGIDFTGGRILWFQTGVPVKTADVEKVMAPFDIKHNPVQIMAGGYEFTVKTEEFADPQKAIAFGEKIRSLLIAFNVEFHEIDPASFKLLRMQDQIKASKLKDVLKKAGFPEDAVTLVDMEEVPPVEEGDVLRYNMTFRFNGIDKKEDQKKLATALYDGLGGFRQFTREDKVDPVFGIELRNNAATALIIAIVCMLIYISIRFEFWYAVAGIIALLHDCIITIGFYSIFQLEVNSAFVAIILTVFGYSINDTIIIFDRMRENIRKNKKMSLDAVVNTSLWETMARSINTMLTTQMAIVAILLLGGQSIKDFALGMCVGVFAGGYSSIFLAASMVYLFKTFESKKGAASAPQTAGSKSKKASAPAPVQERETRREKTAPAASSAPRAPQTASQDSTEDDKKKKDNKKHGKQRRR